MNIGSNVILIRQGLLLPHSNTVPLSIALVGDWIVGKISGKVIGIAAPVEIVDQLKIREPVEIIAPVDVAGDDTPEPESIDPVDTMPVEVAPVDTIDHERDIILHVFDVPDAVGVEVDPELVGIVSTVSEIFRVTFL
jgi:hypothetical protein